MGQLELRNLTIDYRNKPVIEDLSIKIHDGELVSLLGPSGVGKTTILKAIAGLVKPRSGEILINGKRVNHLPADRRDAVLVFQKPLLFPFLNVEQNIGFGLKMAKVDRHKVCKKIEKITEITGLQGLTKRKIHQLSGGQQQRVALARGLILEPSLLLLDEPLSSLDAELRQQMRKLIARVQEQTGTTMIFVTHDQSEAFAISRRICLLLDGRLRQAGTPKELFFQPADREVASFFGCTNFFQGKINKTTFAADFFNCPSSLGDSPKATAVIRPEDITVTPSAGMKATNSAIENSTTIASIAGKIRQIQFEGSLTRLTVETAHGIFTALCLSSTYEKHQEVSLSFSLKRIHIFKQNTDK